MATDLIDHVFLATLISSLAGGIPVIIDPVQPEPFVSPTIKARIFIDVRALQGLGWDQFVRVYDDDSDLQVSTQDGNRLFVLYLKAESFIPTLHAHDILELLRRRLWRPSSLAQLRTQNMTLTHAETTVDLPTSYDSRVISASALDLQMALRFNEVDDTDDGIWIESYDLEYDPTGET